MQLPTLLIFLYYFTSFSLASSRHSRRAIVDPDPVDLNFGLVDPSSVDAGSDDPAQPDLDAYQNFEIPQTYDLAFRPDPHCPGTVISCCLGDRCVSYNVDPNHRFCKNIVCCDSIDWTVVLDDHDHLIGKGKSCKQQPATGTSKNGVQNFINNLIFDNGVHGGGGGGGLAPPAAAEGGGIFGW